MKEVVLCITKDDVIDGPSGLRWLIRCLNECGCGIEHENDMGRMVKEKEMFTLMEDLAPLFHRMRDFLSVAPNGEGRIIVAMDCNPIHVAVATWGTFSEEK